MFSSVEQDQAARFFEVLKTEAIPLTPSISWVITDDCISVSSLEGFELILSVEDEQYVVKHKMQAHREIDFIDGLVRIRFELLRHLNPTAFS